MNVSLKELSATKKSSIRSFAVLSTVMKEAGFSSEVPIPSNTDKSTLRISFSPSGHVDGICKGASSLRR
jgi:hypothetical protein